MQRSPHPALLKCFIHEVVNRQDRNRRIREPEPKALIKSHADGTFARAAFLLSFIHCICSVPSNLHSTNFVKTYEH